MTDLYEELGVPRDASVKDIRAAYKRKASKVHPDRNHDNPEATNEFQRLNNAYSILSKPDKREHYDRTGEEPRQVPTDEEQACHAIVEILGKVIASGDYKPNDYFKEARKAVQNALRGATQEAAQLTDQIRRFRYLIKSSKSNPIVMHGMEQSLKSMEQQKQRAEEGKKLTALALEILDASKYEGELPEQSNSDFRWATGWHGDPIINTGPMA